MRAISERFEVERVAGEGGMGTIFRARDARSGAIVALKVLNVMSADERERFVREAEVLSELRHPAIVRYVAHGVSEDGRPYLAMEWLEGEDLESRLARGELSIDDSVRLTLRVAEALGVAHAAGVVHRDVKPSNLFLVAGDAGDVRVCDFGIARVRGRRPVTQTGMLVGTPGYMSPEQARGEALVDARADVFALGCVLFECFTGRPTFVGEHIAALLARVLLEDAPRVSELRPEIAPELDELVAQMLSKEPSARPADGAAVAERLRARAPKSYARPAAFVEAPRSLGGSERRLLSVVLVARARIETRTGSDTLVDGHADPSIDRLKDAASSHGAELSVLADGSIVAVMTGSRAATDMVAQAARCALAMRSVIDAPMALTTGHAEITGRLPVGAVVERAAALVRRAAAGIRIDDATAGLLDARFEVRGDVSGLELRSERELAAHTRTLLGKPTACVGRERELSTLMALFEECASEGVARVAVVTGPAGIGKSRVRHELVKRLAEREEEPAVWFSRGDSVRAGAPYGVVAPPIRLLAGIQEGEPDMVRQRKLAARVARSVAPDQRARVAAFLGEMIGVSFPDDATRELLAARRDGIVMGDHMRLAWQDFLAAETSDRPVVLVVEDLQWGDRPSIALVDLALRNLAERPLFVVAFARPDVDEAFPALWSERAPQRLALGELSRKASDKLVRGVLASATDAEVVRIVERGAGNAFYLEELVRACAEGRGDDLPETVLAMVETRLGALDAELRRVLRAASVFGQVFWSGAVASLVGRDVDAHLHTLVQREVIARFGEGRFPGETEWAFRHANLRDAAYAMLTDADRALGHKLAGEWLEKTGEDGAMTLAEHFERAGELERTKTWYRRAAEQALEGNDFETALVCAERGVKCGARGVELGAIRLFQSEVWRYRSNYRVQLACAEEARALLPRGSDEWLLALGEIVNAAQRLGDVARFSASTEEFFAVCTEPRTDAEILCAARLATAALHIGDQRFLVRVWDSLERAQPTTAFVRARVLQVRAFAAASDPSTVAELCAAATRAFDEAGDVRVACQSRINEGDAIKELGDYARAEDVFRAAREEASRMGLVAFAALAKHNLGLVVARRGRIREGLAIELEALDDFTKLAEPRLAGSARVYVARIHAMGGDFASAAREARAAKEILATCAPPIVPEALSVLAEAELGLEHPQAALDAVMEAVHLETLHPIEEGEGLMRLVHARALRACGRNEEAAMHIETAKARLLERAAALSDGRLRKTFLEDVPEHARTLELAEAWRAPDESVPSG